MPFASISNVTSICGTPRRAGAIPSRRNVPSCLLSFANSRSPCALEQAERAREDLTEMIRQIGATGLDRLRELDQADREGQCFIGPFVAMIEQSLSGGEMKPQRDQRFNGRYAVVYFDPKKWSSPLIDICGTPYNREEAEERMKVLKAALRREQDEKGGSSE